MTDDEDWSYVNCGIGSMHDLREAIRGTPRLLGMKSVSEAAAYALQRREKVHKPQPFGFRRK